MKVTPRKEEVAAVVKLLEDDTFPSADALAKAIIKQVGELFAERDWYAWIWRENPKAWQFAFGPVSSPAEVKRMAERSGLGGEHMSLHLYGSKPFWKKINELPPSVYCSACQHPDHCHEIPKYNGRCWVKGCKCKKLDKSSQTRL